MASFRASTVRTPSSIVVPRVTLTDADNTIIGSNAIFVCATPTAARAITVPDWDSSSFNEYNPEVPPMVIIKCAKDCSVNNITISNSAGVLKTLSLDYSSNTVYVVLRLTAARVWELA